MDLGKLGGLGSLANIGETLQRYVGGSPQNEEQVHKDFDHVAQSAPSEHLANGVAEAFRSNQTPPFPQMLAKLFDRSDSSQRAGLLNQLIGAGGGSLLSGLLGNVSQGKVTPDQAQKVPTEAVERAAAQAQQQNPSIVDSVSNLYAQHPQLLKTLGGAALSIALAKIAQKQFPGR